MDSLTLSVQWLSPPDYWAEDYAPPGPPDRGWYILLGSDIIDGPYPTQTHARAVMRGHEALCRVAL